MRRQPSGEAPRGGSPKQGELPYTASSQLSGPAVLLRTILPQGTWSVAGLSARSLLIRAASLKMRIERLVSPTDKRHVRQMVNVRRRKLVNLARFPCKERRLRRRHPRENHLRGSMAGLRSPADASPIPSRATAHGLGPMRIATPSSRRTLTACSLPVSRRTSG
jgi:hypothetical protein